MTPLVLIHLKQLYAVNLQATLLLPVKHSCAMTAGAAARGHVRGQPGREEAETGTEKEGDRDVPLKPNPIFYL